MRDRTDKDSKETAQKQQTSDEQKKDDFWDLDNMLPRRAKQQSPADFAPRDTSTVEIDAPHVIEDNPGMDMADEVRIPLPPTPNITNRMQRAAAYRRQNRSFPSENPENLTPAECSAECSANRYPGSKVSALPLHTPGDVAPQMAQPVCSYVPENSFIKHVGIFRWPERFSYYERFTADAERYYNRTAGECPFVNFFAYMPQYAAMSQDQLRWYLYWRDNVRHGVYLASDYSYIFLYVYEIINLPDKIPPNEGLQKLCDLWLAYREQFPRLDRYLGEWVCDYCLVWELPAPLNRLADILPTLVSILTFREFYIEFNADGDCPITAQLCDVLTGAQWKQSKYLTRENRPLFEEHLYTSVLGALRYAWETDPDFVSLLGFSEVQQSRNAFSGALCTYACKRRIDVSYLSLSRSYQLKFIVSDLFKLAENCIRAHLGIKARLNAAGVPEILKTYIKDYFARVLPPPQKQAKTAKKPSDAASPKSAAEKKRLEEESAYAALYEPLSTTLSPTAALALEQDSWANTELLVPIEEDHAQNIPSGLDAPLSPTEPSLSAAPDPDDNPAAAVGSAAAGAAAAGCAVSDTAEAEDDSEEDILYDDPYENFVRHLNTFYYTALKHIICREEAEFSALCASAAMLGDAVADAINELAVTYTDDTVLDADGSFWSLSDFYANDVMNAVCAREDDA